MYGLGPLNYAAQRGLYLYPTWFVATAREPLGVPDAWMWPRDTQRHCAPQAAPPWPSNPIRPTKLPPSPQRIAVMANGAHRTAKTALLLFEAEMK